MKSQRSIIYLLVFVLFLAACGGGTAVTSDAVEPEQPQQEELALAPEAEPVDTIAPEPTSEPALSGDPVRGGLLYDQWWVVLNQSTPEGNHPLWATQTSNTRTGGDTWRCKECHGWDYKGVEGAYGSGSHMTGFPGIFAAAQNMSLGGLLESLKGSTNPDHDFSAYMDDQALTDLALFMSETLIDMDELVNADLTAKSDVDLGAEEYDETCTRCHGPAGDAINFGDIAEPEFIGHLAPDNPWEFIHKVRYGQPGWPMPSSILNEWSNEDVANVLAYAQTFVTEPTASGGGLLYDNWWVPQGMDAPTGDHPLWATQSTNTRTGVDTWRCKECHGWDYQGVEGAYGSGSHITGFPGILSAADMTAEEIISWLNGEQNADHDFSSLMSEAAMAAMVRFIQEEMMTDLSGAINDDKSSTGDSEMGRALYDPTCAECHGENGRELNFGDADDPEFLGTLALDNPWETVHKAAHGQPGEPMPSGIAMAWTLEQYADLLAYLQTLPVE
jgi:thiosulfate dehydrogenase